MANVVEETSEDNEKWQEVYPHDRHVIIGEDDVSSVSSLGSDDEAAGHGNYVFIVWRHYQGCMPGAGDVIVKTADVPDPVHR